MSKNQGERVLGRGDLIDTKLSVWVRAKRRRRGSSSRVAGFISSLSPSVSFMRVSHLKLLLLLFIFGRVQIKKKKASDRPSKKDHHSTSILCWFSGPRLLIVIHGLMWMTPRGWMYVRLANIILKPWSAKLECLTCKVIDLIYYILHTLDVV